MSGPLVIIGGHEDRENQSVILKEFLNLAGGNSACIVIVTTATRHPEQLGEEYLRVFKKLGAAEVRLLNVSTREDTCSDKDLKFLEEATGVFFTGGDQARTTSVLGGTEIDWLLRRRHEEGLVLGGTSAGASIMADTMILTGSAEASPRAGNVNLGSGMGFIRDVLIDQHFAERGRVGRLVGALAQHPRYLGIGIDENTCIIVEAGRFRVMGAGSVWVIDAAALSYSNFLEVDEGGPLALANLRLFVVPAGFTFDLQRRALMTPTGEAARE